MFMERTDPVVAEFDRMTQQLFGGADAIGMPIDVLRRGDDLVVRVDVPGVPADAVSLTLENSVLTISAARRASYADGEQVLVHERFDGTMTRRLRVPEWVDVARAEASHADGVLTVRLPVAERARPRTISVQAAGTTGAGSSEITAPAT